ncbi:MAG: polysaccharide biosynthesis tyrosine autokinase [Burkholderiales bacterium]|nr:polysaccharide biosynthesis tyrosine autokinase [Burkholderiales bacterium]
MPDNETPRNPPAAVAAALPARPSTALSTYVTPALEAGIDDDESIHLRDLWRVVVKRKWVVLAVLVIVVLTGLAATMMATPIYRSSITLKIEREASKVVDFKGAPVEPQEYGDIDFYRTQYELLKSRSLAERVVRQLDLRQRSAVAPEQAAPWWRKLGATLFPKAADAPAEASAEAPPTPADGDAAAVGAFMGSLTVEPVRNSRLVRVLFDSPDRKLAAEALNALAQNFIALSLERRFDASSYAKAFLEEKLAQTKAKLEESERALVAFQREQQIINIDDKQNVLAQTLGAYNAAAAKVGEDRVHAEALYREFRDNPASSPQMLDNKAMSALREQRTKLQVEYQDLLRIYKPAFPKMQQLAAAIAEVDKKIAEETDIARRSIEGSYNVAVQQETAIKAKLDQAKKDMLDLQGRSIRFGILKREVDTNRSLYDGLLQRLKEVGVEAGVGTNNVTIVDPAIVSPAPFKPNLTRNLQLAVALGLLLGIGLAFFLEYLDDTMQRPDDMERIARLPVLGVIPLVKIRKASREPPLALQAHSDARSTFAEAYRSMRTALQFSTREGAPHQLVVTSTGTGEGKSTTALALAINFAQIGRTTLLIDADLRNPSLHSMLGVDNSRGLSNYLSSDLPALGVVRVTSIPNLYVIPAGPVPPNPVELLSGPKMIGLLAELERRFPSIVLDSPPVLGLADALVLGNQVGAMVFVVAAGSTRKAHLRAALKRLRQASVAPVGAVMTKVDMRDGRYGYESAYYYYRSTNDAPKLAQEST